MSFVDIIKADTFRHFGSFSWFRLIKGLLIYRNFRLIIIIRICKSVYESKNLIQYTLPFFRFVHYIVSQIAAIDLSWQTDIGAAFIITHGWGAVVSHGSKIGKNVTIFHGVTIGRRDRILSDGKRVIGYPVIEDDVWIGPHAIIVGDIVIGQGSRIAGGSFVTESVPPFSIVSGNPSTIIKMNCQPDVMNKVDFV